MASISIHKLIRILHQDFKMNNESKIIRDEIRILISKNRKILKSIEPERKNFEKGHDKILNLLGAEIGNHFF